MPSITYQSEPGLSVAEFRTILIASTLGDRRPVEDLARLEKMLLNADLILTARKGGKLIGVARSVTDQCYCTYLSDLAVHREYQKLGTGRMLVKQTKATFPQANLILLSAPKAVAYYPKIGMKKHENCFISGPEDQVF